MPPLAHLDHLEAQVDDVHPHIGAGRPVWVVGATGSGRGTVLDRLHAVLPGAVRVRLLELDEVDAVADALVQATAGLREPARRRVLADASLDRMARGCADDLAEAGATLLIDVPFSWLRSPAEADPVAARARRVLEAWLRHPSLRLVAAGPSALARVYRDDERGHTVHLPRVAARLDALVDDARWGSYAKAARRLRDALPRDVRPSPLEVRVAVGLVALGRDAGAVAAHLQSPAAVALDELADGLVRQLGQPAHREVKRAVRRLLESRRPVEPEPLLRLTDVPEEHAPLVLECLAYGPARRMSGLLRKRLLSAMRTAADAGELDATHGALADYHAGLDGCRAPWQVAADAVTHWIEKLHHLSHAGEARRAEWEAQERPLPAFFWDRGRHLSVERRDFAGAAAVYRACVERFPGDDYGWHYLAFNLERGGGAAAEVERCYRRAIELDAGNPWWNGRLVTFLITRGRPRRAAAEWNEAIERVDPDGERVGRDPWLAEQLHQWVARTWLTHGRAAEAAAIVRGLPESVVRESERLGRLTQEVADAVEAERLGLAVYPASVPIERRWRAPRVLAETLDGAALRSWYPGRIVRASAGEVEVAYAVPTDPPEQRRVAVTRLSAEAWRAIGFGMPEQARGFVELGIYDGDRRAVARVPDDAAPVAPIDADAALAALRRWRSP